MKILFMRLLCNAFYYAGDAVSYLVEYVWSGFYPVYNWLMGKSADISDKYNLEIWKDASNDIGN